MRTIALPTSPAPHRPIQHDTVRGYNRLAVLSALSATRAATKAELAQRTGLSVPTVATIAAELGALGVAEEGELVPSTGGRPARQFRLVPESRNVLALDLSGDELRYGRLDLCGEFRRSDGSQGGRLSLAPGFDEELMRLVPQFIDEYRAEGATIGAVAVAVPGVVDRDSGHVRLAPALGWSEQPLGDMLGAATGLPVLLENDVNAVALSELLHGAAVGRSNVLYLTIGSGIGAAIVLDGKLFRGSTASAGEIGYSLFAGLPRAGLDLGAAGPFERHLVALSHGFVKDGRLDVSGAPEREAFDQFVEMIRLALHNLACVLDPELIVVAWSADPDGELARALADAWLTPQPVEVRANELGSSAALRGVGQLALRQLTAGLCGLGEAGWSATNA